MIRLRIRERVLLASLLPVALALPLLAAIIISSEVNHVEGLHRQRALALARQFVSTSEFAVFTVNRPALEALVAATMREPDVKSITLVDARGKLLAAGGAPNASVTKDIVRVAGGARSEADPGMLIVLPVLASEVPLESAFDGAADNPRPPAAVLGYLALELSRESVAAHHRQLMLVGGLATLAGLLLGCILAVALSRVVTRPIGAVFAMIERFGAGELSARVPSRESSPVRALEQGLNLMAERIERGRDELEKRIAEATAELRVKKDEAERANRAKSRFLAAASHDLRQPIHALRLFTESLEDEMRDQARASRILGRIKSTVDSTAQMFDALLDISKLEAGVMEKHVEEFPVQTLLQRLEVMFSPMAVEHGLRLSVVHSSAWVRTDPSLADRLLQNLVSNALKYTQQGGVVIGCRRRRESLSIEVWDSGPGIAPEHQREIFYEFVQLENAARDTSRGLGIGLAIVERISRLLDHPVRLRSVPGRGSVFSVEMPYGHAAAPAPAPRPSPQATYRFAGVRVAVVDDETATLEAMGELLRRWGCRVCTARSQAELLATLAKTKGDLDLLICDYRLRAGENGLVAVEAIRRALAKRLPAVIITADTAPDRLKEAHGSGLPLLHKPVPPEALRAAMWQVLARTKDPEKS